MDKKLSAGFGSLIFIILIAFLVIGAVLWFVFKGTGSQTSPSSPTLPKSTTPQPQSKSAAPDDWLTYQNPKYNYQISYPAKFHAQADNEPPYPPPPVSKAFTYKYDNGEWCDFLFLGSVNIEGFKGEISLIRDEGKETESIVPIAGVNAIVFDAQGGEAIDRTYYIDQNNPVLRMGYSYKAAGKYSQDCADIIEKMVASFKFLE